MILKFGVALIAFVFLVLSCETSSDSEFNDYYIKFYGQDGDQSGVDLIVNSDGSLMVLGISEFENKKRIYLVKTNSEGDVIWERELGDVAENPIDIEPIIGGTPPYVGGYLILSNIETGGGNTAIKVLRVNSDGVKIDSIQLDLDINYLPSNFGNSITPLSNGGFILTGNSTQLNLLPADNSLVDPIDQTDLLSLRFNESFVLDPAWLQSFGGEPDVMGIKIFEISPLRFDFVGYTNAVHSGEPAVPLNYDYNFWFVRLDGFGSNGISGYKGDSFKQEIMASATRSTSGQYMAVGTVKDATGIQRVYASRVIGGFPTSNLDFTWNNEGEGKSIAVTNSGKFLIVGNEITAGGTRNIWITKVDINFSDEPGFPRSFGSSGNDDTASAVAGLPNGDIVILGTMNLTNQNKIALIKLKSNGRF